MLFPLFLLRVALFYSDLLPSIFCQQYGTLITVCGVRFQLWANLNHLAATCFWCRLWGRLGSWIFGSSFKRCWVRWITFQIPLVSMQSQCFHHSVLVSWPVLWWVCYILVWTLFSVILCIHISLASCLVALNTLVCTLIFCFYVRVVFWFFYFALWSWYNSSSHLLSCRNVHINSINEILSPMQAQMKPKLSALRPKCRWVTPGAVTSVTRWRVLVMKCPRRYGAISAQLLKNPELILTLSTIFRWEWD